MEPFTPPEAHASGGSAGRLVLGVGTCLYALTFGCGCGAFVPMTLAVDPLLSLADEVLMGVCIAAYVAGFVPGVAGVLRSGWFRPLFVAWALVTCACEAASIVSYGVSHGEWITGVCSLVMFLAWPAVGLVAIAAGVGR